MRAAAMGFVFACVITCGSSAFAEDSSGTKPDILREAPSRGKLVTPLAVTGGGLAMLGVVSIFASGIAYTIAAAEAARLDKDCPHKQCVEGSDGAKALESARDAQSAATWMFALGLPVTTAGLVLLLYSGELADRTPRVVAAPVISPTGGGAHVRVRF